MKNIRQKIRNLL